MSVVASNSPRIVIAVAVPAPSALLIRIVAPLMFLSITVRIPSLKEADARLAGVNRPVCGVTKEVHLPGNAGSFCCLWACLRR